MILFRFFIILILMGCSSIAQIITHDSPEQFVSDQPLILQVNSSEAEELLVQCYYKYENHLSYLLEKQ